MYHFFSVAFYAIWILFTQPKSKAIPYPEDVDAVLSENGRGTPSDSGVEVETESTIRRRKPESKAVAALENEEKTPGVADYPRLMLQSIAVVSLSSFSHQ
jgi:hypothetical protein